MARENIIALLSILISAVVAIAGIIIAHQTEMLRSMREQLSEKKCKVYADAEELVNVLTHRCKKLDELLRSL